MRFPSRRWRLWLLAALPLVGAVVLGCALALWPGPGVTEANFEKLQEGMTPEQVAEILGTENLVSPSRPWRRGVPGNSVWWVAIYGEQDGDVLIFVGFSGDRLKGKTLERVPLTLADFLRTRLAKVRRRIGL